MGKSLDNKLELKFNGGKSTLTKNDLFKRIFKQSGVFWALVVLFVIATFLSPTFIQSKNLVNVVRQISITGIVSIGMTFVILTGGIDLSVGSIVGVVAVVCASALKAGMPEFIVVIIGLVIGLILGSLNGLGITAGKIVPFIMTLGTYVALRGVAMMIANGQPTNWTKTGIKFDFLGGQSLIGIPVSVWVFVLVFVIAALILKYTPYGRYVYAVGDNAEAARLSGIKIKSVLFSVYAINGMLAGLCALVYISRLSVGEPTAGTGMELDAIAMVYIGGASTAGGYGTVGGTLIGAAIVAIIANMLNLLGISPFIQQVVKGLIIILAVLLERFKKK